MEDNILWWELRNKQKIIWNSYASISVTCGCLWLCVRYCLWSWLNRSMHHIVWCVCNNPHVCIFVYQHYNEEISGKAILVMMLLGPQGDKIFITHLQFGENSQAYRALPLSLLPSSFVHISGSCSLFKLPLPAFFSLLSPSFYFNHS